jgi:hypothetical protein
MRFQKSQAPKVLGEAAPVLTMITLFVLLFTGLASSTDNQHFVFIVTLCRLPRPHHDWGRAGMTPPQLEMKKIP